MRATLHDKALSPVDVAVDQRKKRDGVTWQAPLHHPRLYLLRMGLFLILCAFVVFILYKPILAAFFANPALNGLILGALFIGIVLAIHQVTRLFREIAWVNIVDRVEGHVTPAKPLTLLAPLATFMANREAQIGLPIATLRALLDSIAARLDESREIVRYLAGLLVFLGLLGTFWGLIETVGSVGKIISSMRTGADAAIMFDELKTSLAAPLAGMGVSFSSSLFGLAGSLVLGFLDLQAGQAQNRFYTELEDWLAATSHDPEAANPIAAQSLERLTQALSAFAKAAETNLEGQQSVKALSHLADGVQGLVQNMRHEQQLIRDWVEAQAARERELTALLQRLTREEV
jgi:hypothetical protein